MPSITMLSKKPTFNTPTPYTSRRAHLSDMLRFAHRRLDEERLPEVAGSLTFATVLALVPLLTVAFAIFTSFPLFNTFRSSLEAYFIQNLMPKAISNTILGYLNQFSLKASKLSAVGAVALVITAVSMMDTIERVFNAIWRVKAKRPVTKRIVIYWAILTLGPLLVGMSMTLTSYLFTATSGVVAGLPVVGVLIYTLVSVALTAAAYTLLYTTVPNRYVDWRDAMWGGLVAAIAFEIAKRLFAIFISRFPTYTMVYGAIAALPIFLLWVYLSWLITLIGAVITAALPVVKYERWWHVSTPATAFADAMSILKVLHEARSGGETAAVGAGSLRERTGLGFDESENLLQKMLDAGWVGRIRPDKPGGLSRRARYHGSLDAWTLLANPENLKLADIYRLFMFRKTGDAELEGRVERAISAGLDESLAHYFGRRQALP